MSHIELRESLEADAGFGPRQLLESLGIALLLVSGAFVVASFL